MSIRIGQWKKIVVSDSNRVLYQCSECGNIENEEKDICCICKSKMFKQKEVQNDKNYSLRNSEG